MILFVALVAVTAYLSVEFQRTVRNEKEIIEQAKLFSGKELENVVKISLRNKSGDFVFERKQEEQAWHMVSPKTISASSLFIDQLFNSLNVIKTKKLMPENAINMSNFSLNKPTATLTLSDGVNKTIIIHVGIMNTIDNSTYLKIQGRPGIYHVEAPSISLENAALSDLIETRIFALDSDQLTSIIITKKLTAVPVITLKKEPEGWIDSGSQKIDANKLEDLLQSFNGLTSSFILDKMSDAQARQLLNLMKNPEFQVRVVFSDGNTSSWTISAPTTQLVDIDLKSEPYFLISSSVGNIVYVVKKESITVFDQKAESLLSVQPAAAPAAATPPAPVPTSPKTN